uniref:Uncharacterized protein n=1 Tax=Anopheles atroparvus TaxID=41427 RepID=A0A182IT96_ANOAO
MARNGVMLRAALPGATDAKLRFLSCRFDISPSLVKACTHECRPGVNPQLGGRGQVSRGLDTGHHRTTAQGAACIPARLGVISEHLLGAAAGPHTDNTRALLIITHARLLPPAVIAEIADRGYRAPYDGPSNSLRPVVPLRWLFGSRRQAATAVTAAALELLPRSWEDTAHCLP